MYIGKASSKTTKAKIGQLNRHTSSIASYGSLWTNSVMRKGCNVNTVLLIYHNKTVQCQYSATCTPQQNGIAKRWNRTLIDAARTMLCDSKLPVFFWAEAMNTGCYV